MNWLQPIDLYCERTMQDAWAEPINSLTNLTFLIGAIVAYRLYRRAHKNYPETPLLIALLCTIGIGSALFHIFANQWSLLADIIPILLFQIVALWVFLRRALVIKTVTTIICIALFVIVSQLATVVIPDAFLNGSAGYLPSLLTVAMLAFFLRKKDPSTARFLAIAAGIFLVSVSFRSLDILFCQTIPFGTHFMWHILNGTMLTCIIVAAISSANTQNVLRETV